jgi:hypothetical protein
MSGDDRVRHCASCKLDVYNISAMTAVQAEDLILSREGRLCIRLYKRADGTVLTRDCPAGLRAYRKRAAKFAGAALTAILGLFSISFGQKKDAGHVIDASKIKVTKTVNREARGTLTGTITDPNGALVPGARLKAQDKASGQVFETTSSPDGAFSFKDLPAGTFSLLISASGFKKSRVVNIRINAGEEIKLTADLAPDAETIMVGIFGEEPLIDTSSSSVTTKITQDLIQKLPH